nr:GNAT family protein [Aureimonas ureilytica]
MMLPNDRTAFANARGIGVLDDDGRLVAGVLYHGWEPEAGVIEMSSASLSRRWLTRPVLDAIFRYPFEGIGCQLVALRVSERNTHLHRILRAFGFAEFFIPRLRGRDEGEIIFTLTDDAWRSGRFQKGATHGQEGRERSAGA